MTVFYLTTFVILMLVLSYGGLALLEARNRKRHDRIMKEIWEDAESVSRAWHPSMLQDDE